MSILQKKAKTMILDLLSRRFSLRMFQDKPVPSDVIHDILEAGRLSPSGGNEQPWTFGVITDHALISRISELACRQAWIAKAPLLIVLCTVCVGDDRCGRDTQKNRFPDYAQAIEGLDQGLFWALNQEEHQTKIAGSHMALAALEQGVGSCWVSLFDVMRLAKLLNLPEGTLPSEILVLGYPAEQRKVAGRKGLEEIVFRNTFGR